nr:MAG TPA: hypothetical protein [Caudoviricetes sp.]
MFQYTVSFVTTLSKFTHKKTRGPKITRVHSLSKKKRTNYEVSLHLIALAYILAYFLRT